MRIKHFVSRITVGAVIACSALCGEMAFADTPSWAESDSAQAVEARIKKDFPWNLDEGYRQLKKKYPRLSRKEFDKGVEQGWIETLNVDGQKRVHRKAVGNYALLNPKLSKWEGRGSASSQSRRDIVENVIKNSIGTGDLTDVKRYRIKFSADVPTDGETVKENETVRVWLPFPMETERQHNIKVVSSTPGSRLSKNSAHSTMFFEVPAGKDTTHVEYIAEFDVASRWFNPEFIEKSIKPYNRNSELYKTYTQIEEPDIIRLDSLAQAITGGETDPFRCSELVFDWIVKNIPWAGAREYSTINSIPTYVIEKGHGDCGQVALFYISLMRTLGIPARWESGWMFHPGEKNLHDWAEVYFEGVGWVPVDVSFGRYSNSTDPLTKNFYSTGTDSYHIAMNKGVRKAFDPAKKYIRSETVDSQMGEVETDNFNLFYPGWDSSLQILEVEQVDNDLWALPRISVACMRDEPSHGAELVSQCLMGMPVKIMNTDDDWYEVMSPEGYTGWVTAGSLALKSDSQMKEWRESPRLVVTSIDQIKVYNDPVARGSRNVLTDLVNGNIVSGTLQEGSPLVEVTLPDGRKGWADASNFTEIEQWASQPFSPERILETAYTIEGTPYLWGANSTKALDCSGLVKTCYLSNGIIMRRDASQQARTGKRVEAEDWPTLEAGDLLFFGNPRTGKVTHVAIHDNNGDYIHSSGRVRRNSVNPDSEGYLTTPFLHAVSVQDQIGTFGITPVISHPWYFNKK